MDRRVLLAAAVAVALLALPGISRGVYADEASTAASATTEPATGGAALGAKAQAPEPRKGAQKFSFQAEVTRLMDIIIHSLYSNKDIFLRELISNASDALDKLRFLALTDKSQLGDTPDLEIRIKVDKEKRTLEIRDTGVGMTKDDLVKNLGTIAKSGTSAFLEQMQKGGDMNLIGQFGVGFYSVYLVSDYVEVMSKHNDDKQYIWESAADGNFAVSEDTENAPLGRGTLVRMHLKEDTQEYLEEAKLRELVGKYSEFINFPIHLYASKQVDREVPADEDADEADADGDKDADDKDAEDDVEDADEDDDKAKTKTVKETVWDWDLLNDNKALWLRSPADVSEAEYTKFYQALAKSEYEAPLSHVHFKAEGDVEFRALLYVPDKAPPNFLGDYTSAGNKAALKLYVRRVFISEDFEELIPRYLSFLRGVVDSDTLPLSVSRETLQAHASLKTIKKKIVRKLLDMFKKMADAEQEVAGKEDAEDDAERAGAGAYAKFYAEFGKAVKLGIIEDPPNRNRLAKLLRFHTSKSGDKMIGLDEYVARMQPDQKQIYYLSGASKEELAKSPFLEKLLQKGLEVVFMTDAIDEYVMSHLTEYDDAKFQNASKDNLKLGKDDKKAAKALKAEFKELVAWWKELLGQAVTAVRVSDRLATSPAIVVTSQYGWSANMERIMKAQALASDEKSYMKGQKTLEINPRHPLVQELRRQFEADKESQAAASMARVLYDTALLESGFDLEAPKAFNERVYQLLAGAFGIKGDLAVSPADAAAAAAADEGDESEESKAEAAAMEAAAASASAATPAAASEPTPAAATETTPAPETPAEGASTTPAHGELR